ncbi:MAG: hypothetical protein NZM05_12680, partial [Chloroherpetonaceae bacterium]|nr:hypothetical protein [Chloroherpetonaceae bacterium]
MSEPIKISEPEPPQSPKGVPAEEAISIDISHIQTEDDAPVDSLFAERQGRLLVESLYASWKPSEPFLACEHVGVFYGLHLPPI